jgi:hypothetical protein
MRLLLALTVYKTAPREGGMVMQMNEEDWTEAVDATCDGLIEIAKKDQGRVNMLLSYYASVYENMKLAFPEIAQQVRKQNIEHIKNQNK